MKVLTFETGKRVEGVQEEEVAEGRAVERSREVRTSREVDCMIVRIGLCNDRVR